MDPLLLKDVEPMVVTDPLLSTATGPPVIAKVGPAAFEPLMRFRRSDSDKELLSESFWPESSLIRDWY